MITRIYFPTRPSAVNALLKYTARLGWGYRFRMFYRIHHSLNGELKIPSTRSEPKVTPTGWRRIIQAHPADNDDDDDIFIRDLEPKEIAKVHSALFSISSSPDSPAKLVNHRETVRLLMAAVGFPFRVADPGARKEDRNSEDGQMTECGSDYFRVDHLYEKIGDKIRETSLAATLYIPRT